MKTQEVQKSTVKGSKTVRISPKAMTEIAEKTAKAQALADMKDEPVKVAKPAKEAKPVKEPKPAKVVKEPKESFTRIQAVGIIMRTMPQLNQADIISWADQLFHEKTGKPLNRQETVMQLSKAKKFLLGFQKPVLRHDTHKTKA
jgi:hypothetical protein